MESLKRVLPFVWPYRNKFLLASLLAFLIALLWGLNLSVAFPIVKVLLQGESLAEYVQKNIDDAEQEIELRSAGLEKTDERIAKLTDEDERLGQLQHRSRLQSKLSAASKELAFMSWIQANVIPKIPRDQFDTFAAILLVLLIATVIKGILIFFQEILVGNLVELTILGIRKACFRKTLSLDYQTLMIKGGSDLMSRFTFDMNQLSAGLRFLGGKVIREPLKALVCITGAFLVSWQLTLLSFVFAPLVGIVFYMIGKKIKRASHKLMQSMSRIYKTMEETFAGIKVVIAFNGARQHRLKFHHENKAYFSKAVRLVKLQALTSPSTEVIGLLAVFVALLPASYLVLRETTSIWGITLSTGPMDVARLGTLYAMLAGAVDPVRKLSTIYARLKRASAAAERVFAIIDSETLVKQPVAPVRVPQEIETIQFDKIDFGYATSNENAQRPAVLKEVNLKVRAGETIVVVGGNGSGKSTLVSLLPRYFDPDSGTVSFNDVDIKNLRLEDLRNQLGVVTQETLLFDGTIADNIRYGSPSATDFEVEQAAKKAFVTQFTEQLPDQLETHVGDKGQQLSGGQRQRIALARAILRNPKILILDEATSAVDAQSEFLIHQSLREFTKGRTTFLITHTISQSILDFVSRIAVMDEGKLIACGTHEALLETCPAYKQLLQSQVRQSAA